MPHLPAPGPQARYTSPVNNNSYLLNTKPMNFSNAQAWCNSQGGHLTSYTTQAEQYEVESAYQNMGVFFPLFHIQYWIGLSSR